MLMKIRGSVVSLSFIFPHLPQDKKKEKKKSYADGSEANNKINRPRNQRNTVDRDLDRD